MNGPRSKSHIKLEETSSLLGSLSECGGLVVCSIYCAFFGVSY